MFWGWVGAGSSACGQTIAALKSIAVGAWARHNSHVGDRVAPRIGVWGLFSLIVAVIAGITALICLLATPDFGSIAAYRVGDSADGAVTSDLRIGATAPSMVYLPHAGGAPVVAIDGNPATPPTSHIDARLTRNLQLLTARARGDARITIAQSPGLAPAPLGPVYAGPEAALHPVFEQQLWWGRVMQSAIPAAAWFAIAMSLLLIFFSRQPSKYMLLIAAFTLQLIIELEISPAWLGFQLNDYDRIMGIFTQLLIWRAVASWTGSHKQSRILILALSAVVLLVFALTKIFDGTAIPGLLTLATVIHIVWLVLIQAVNWRMVISADIPSDLFRAGTLACFLLAITGVLSYRFLALGGYSTGAVFFLSNWVNVASSIAVFAFVVGALANEVQSYRQQRRTIGDLSLVAAGHHAALSAQQAALRDEIERNAVLEERQRFMRELHDGIGNQLLGLMIKTRGQGADAAPLTDDIQAVIAELRLVTTALDEPDGNLAQVLGVMSQRLEAQAASAGVVLSWDVRLNSATAYPPKLVLDVLRIVQECISNSLKHAAASTIHVAVTDGAGLTIVVADDGAGFDPAVVQAGLGLRNLRTRASAWGGNVAIVTGVGGTGSRVTVDLPLPANA